MFNTQPIHDLKRHYVFGFDLHGVIDQAPGKFLDLFHILKNEGHKIYVISGKPAEQLKTELDTLDPLLLKWIDKVFSIVDFLKEKNVKLTQDRSGNYWTDDVAWWSSKAQICKENNVDYMIDDTFTYQHFFDGIDTQFVHVNWN